MKFLSLIMLIMLSYSCLSIVQKKTHSEVRSMDQDSTLYRVYKIDSIHNYYLIYAKRKHTLYKIVSEKVGLKSCNPIRVNQEYAFDLESRLANRQSSKFKLTLEASLLVNCFSYDDSTYVCLERDSINDLHSAKNVKGLCFQKNYKSSNLSEKSH